MLKDYKRKQGILLLILINHCKERLSACFDDFDVRLFVLKKCQN